MWTRKSVKEKGKKCFYLNFWKCVLVALILAFVIGATSNGSSVGSSVSSMANNFTAHYATQNDDDNDDVDVNVDVDVDDSDVSFSIDTDDTESEAIIAFFIVLGIVIFLASLFITAIGLALRYFLLAPFEYGCRKFFRKNLEEPAKLSNIVYVFDSHYKNVVKTAFMTDLFIWLWSLLFIIPGIIKTYEYRLVPYIVSENPMISFKEAQAESSKLMKGNKWKTFVLDLSFIGWEILSIFTFGLLDIFFVGPYKASTDAALYESLKYGINAQ